MIKKNRLGKYSQGLCYLACYTAARRVVCTSPGLDSPGHWRRTLRSSSREGFAGGPQQTATCSPSAVKPSSTLVSQHTGHTFRAKTTQEEISRSSMGSYTAAVAQHSSQTKQGPCGAGRHFDCAETSETAIGRTSIQAGGQHKPHSPPHGKRCASPPFRRQQGAFFLEVHCAVIKRLPRTRKKQSGVQCPTAESLYSSSSSSNNILRSRYTGQLDAHTKRERDRLSAR